MPFIHYEFSAEGVAVVTLNRPEKHNALNAELSQTLIRRLNEAERDDARVVVLRAAPGSSVWCAGHDVGELDLDRLHDENTTLRIADRIQTLSCPVVALVEGAVYGGGVILLMNADLVIAADNAGVAITSCKLGIPLATELYAYWLRVIQIHKLKELLFTAAPITAQDAYHAGLYNHVVPRGELEEFAQSVVRRILSCSADAVAAAKRQLNGLARQTTLQPGEQAEILRRNRQLLEHPDTRRRVASLLEKLNRS